MRRFSLEECKEIALSRGGKCLSNRYESYNSKMQWECKHGHVWFSTLLTVKRGCWCPECSGKKKYTIEDCKRIALEKKGECLSSEYVNTKTKLNWKCSCGNEWQTVLGSIINLNSWCPVCAIKLRENTCLLKYGVKVSTQCEKVKNKFIETSINKYGFPNPNQNKNIALKVAKKVNNPSIFFHWQTNEELVCQGSYEAKVVDYLNKNKINYRWQPEVFQLSTGKTYRPDLYLVDSDTWVEIKGWMRPDAKEKWDEFKTIKPNSELWDKALLRSRKIIGDK